MTPTNNRVQAKLSLRMWSDSVSFSDVGKRIDLEPAIILEKGEPTTVPKGSGSKYLAKRNYVSFGDGVLDDGAALPLRIKQLLNSVATSDLVPEIQSGLIESTIWLAIFNNDIPWMKFITQDLSDRSAQMNVNFLIENYAKLNPQGSPSITYL